MRLLSSDLVSPYRCSIDGPAYHFFTLDLDSEVPQIFLLLHTRVSSYRSIAGDALGHGQSFTGIAASLISSDRYITCVMFMEVSLLSL